MAKRTAFHARTDLSPRVKEIIFKDLLAALLEVDTELMEAKAHINHCERVHKAQAKVVEGLKAAAEILELGVEIQ